MFLQIFSKLVLRAAACGLICLSFFANVSAAYPERPITLVVPYPPGGATDVIGRIVGKAIADELKVSVVIENKGGAAGAIGATEVAKSKSDGYTLLLAALTSHAVYQNLYTKSVTFDLAKDFQAVSIVGEVPQVLVANPNIKVDSLSQFIDQAKQNPGKYSIASAGNGSTQQMAAIQLGYAADIKLIQVPYRGSGPAMTDLLGGHVDAMFGTVPSVQEHVKSNKLRALIVTSEKRSPIMPDTPTASELGLHDFNVNSLFGVLAPSGTPKDEVEIIARAIEKGLQNSSVKRPLLNQGVIVDYRGPEQTRQAIKTELAKWRKVIDKAKIKAE